MYDLYVDVAVVLQGQVWVEGDDPAIVHNKFIPVDLHGEGPSTLLWASSPINRV